MFDFSIELLRDISLDFEQCRMEYFSLHTLNAHVLRVFNLMFVQFFVGIHKSKIKCGTILLPEQVLFDIERTIEDDWKLSFEKSCEYFSFIDYRLFDFCIIFFWILIYFFALGSKHVYLINDYFAWNLLSFIS